jgi:hypothetical protein
VTWPSRTLRLDGVDEDHWVDRVERPVLPLGHLLHDLVGDPGDRVAADFGAVDLVEVRRDLAGGQTTGGQRQHDPVDAVQAALPLAHDDRVEAGVAISGDLDLDRADLGQHRLGPGSVARVPTITAGRIMTVIAQVLAHILLKGGLQDRLGEQLEHPVRTGQILPAGLPVDGEDLHRRGLDRGPVGHAQRVRGEAVRGVGGEPDRRRQPVGPRRPPRASACNSWLCAPTRAGRRRRRRAAGPRVDGGRRLQSPSDSLAPGWVVTW